MLGIKKKKNEEAVNTKKDVKRKPKKHRVKKSHKGLIESMKIVQSVPSTISDALAGDSSVLQSNSDYIVNDPIDYQGHKQYPVLVLDDESLADAGLGSWGNRNDRSILSRGLKVTTGDTGFVPVATQASLENGFIGLLPTHDAFEVLSELQSIDGYDKGWLVGLIYVDEDDIKFTVTDLRLPFDEWWDFINRKAKFVVNGQGKLILSKDDGKTDKLATTPEEMAGGAKVDGYSIDELDSDEAGSSISDTVNNFLDDSDTTAADLPDNLGSPVSHTTDEQMTPADVKEEATQASNVDSSVDEGLSVDQFMDDDDTDASSNNQPVSETSLPSTDENSQATISQKQPESNSIGSDKPIIQNINSQDELDAQSLTVSASQRQAANLHVTISPDEFMHDYVDNLTFTPLPLVDDHGDPNSLEAYLNRLRQTINNRGKQELEKAKALMRAQVSQGVNSVLTSLVDRLVGDENGSSPYVQQLNEINNKLSDVDSLREQADEKTAGEQQKIDQSFENLKRRRKQELDNQLEREAEKWAVDRDRQKEQVIQEVVGEFQQLLAVKQEGVRREQHEAAQQIASRAYVKLGDVLNEQFQKYVQYLNGLMQEGEKEVQKANKDGRIKELQRLANESTLASHDERIKTLNDQLADWSNRYNAKVSELQKEKNNALNDLQSKMKDKIAEAVAKEAEKTEQEKRRADKLEAEKQKLIKDHKKEVKQIREDNRSTVETLQANNDDLQEDNDKLRQGSTIGSYVKFFGGSLFGAAVAVAITLSFVGVKQQTPANSSSNANSSQPSQTVIYTNPQTQSSTTQQEHKTKNKSSDQNNHDDHAQASSQTQESKANN